MIYNRAQLEWIILNVDYIEKVIAYLNFNGQNDVKIMSGYTPSRYNLKRQIIFLYILNEFIEKSYL